jgi:hypothetical protein
MGAIRQYKNLEGEDISQMGNDVAKVSTLLYCCISSACRADGVEFGLTIDEFADRVDLSQITDFANTLSGDGKSKKK